MARCLWRRRAHAGMTSPRFKPAGDPGVLAEPAPRPKGEGDDEARSTSQARSGFSRLALSQNLFENPPQSRL